MDNADEIDGEEANEEDIVVSSRALETVMEEFEREFERTLKNIFLAMMRLENQYYHHLQQM